MKQAVVIGMLVFLSWGGAWAQDNTTKPNACAEIMEQTGLNHVPVLNSGPFEGRAIDLSYRRPVFPLELKVAQDLSSAYAKFTNFRHDVYDPASGKWVPKFWNAELEITDVQDAIFQIEEFIGFPRFIQLGHSQIRYRMKPGKTLRLTSVDGTETLELDGFIVSLDYASVPEAPFGIPQNINGSGSYNINFSSVQQRYQDQVVRQGHLVRQYLLKTTPVDVARLVQLGLALSVFESNTQPFHLIRHNCDTVAMDYLDRIMAYDEFGNRRYPKGIKAFRLGWNLLTQGIPRAILNALKNRQVIAAELQDWKSEASQ